MALVLTLGFDAYFNVFIISDVCSSVFVFGLSLNYACYSDKIMSICLYFDAEPFKRCLRRRMYKFTQFMNNYLSAL